MMAIKETGHTLLKWSLRIQKTSTLNEGGKRDHRCINVFMVCTGERGITIGPRRGWEYNLLHYLRKSKQLSRGEGEKSGTVRRFCLELDFKHSFIVSWIIFSFLLIFTCCFFILFMWKLHLTQCLTLFVICI